MASVARALRTRFTLPVLLFCAGLSVSCSNEPSGATPTSPTADSAMTQGNTAQLQHIESMRSAYVAARKISIWLPPSYHNSKQSFPVLYMHDGQNVFDPATSYTGIDWGVDEAITKLSADGEIPEAIVVGIWNTEARWREYMPRAIYDQLPQEIQQAAATDYGGAPLSDDYLRFIVEELKPYIDQHYRTLSDATHTSIMGSSMGGLISFYALTEYPEVFGRAGALSTHWPLVIPPEGEGPGEERVAVVRDIYRDYLQQHLPYSGSHRVYFDHGSEHIDAYYAPYQAEINGLLKGLGWQEENDWHSQSFPGATHNEAAWRERIEIPLKFLFGAGSERTVSAGSAEPLNNPRRPIEDEVMYFVMPDRFADGDASNNTGGLTGGADDHGYDPTHKGYFHGGDFKGVLQQLDYLQELGVSALWLTPIFKNKPVQGDPPYRSAGYHGYWITDFTQVDPHLGSNADFKALVDAAHQRGMKVIMDIVTNHTADVIQYRDCNGEKSDYLYRSMADYPYQKRCGKNGADINPGFLGDDEVHQTTENFARLVDLDYAYQPWIPEGEETVKVPGWLNDPRYYHNRGNSLWEGESNQYGDFAGLDDLYTENPRVLEGMIEIYRQWIREFKVDGFRIDTAKHVNDSFWRGFIPAMQRQANALGLKDFYIFGEVYGFEPNFLGRYTREAAFPAVLDFALQSAIRQVISQQKAPSVLAQLFAQDHEYQGDPRGALILPTFLGNHDMGRFGYALREDLGADTDAEELLQRDELAHALLFFSRGVPVIYYGDEQGFTGIGNDQEARQDMFPSQVPSYNNTPSIGTSRSTAEENFDRAHPLFQAFSRMAQLYHSEPGLRRGQQQVVYAADKPGLLILRRSEAATSTAPGSSYLVVINTAEKTQTLNLDQAELAGDWQPLLCSVAGEVAEEERLSTQNGQIQLKMPALSYGVYRSSGSH